MKIVKYKKGSKGKYTVYLDDNRELSLYEEVILKYELLLKKSINDSEFDNINKTNLEWDVYYVGLNSIKSRMKSTYELREYLLKKEYPLDLVDMAIDRLLKQGYLNDTSFAKAYINNQIITTSKGPLKIYRELIDKGVDSKIIDKEIEVFSLEEQSIKIKKTINKGIKSNRTRGGFVLKQKICNDLKIEGYDISLINNIMSEYEFDNNSEIAKREYDKLYRRLSKKYSGSELDKKIKEKMYMKGLKYEED